MSREALEGLAVLGQRLSALQVAGVVLVVGASTVVLGFGERHDPAEATGA